MARAEELLELVGIKNLAGERAASLAYGQQRLLDIARALATEPTLLLLDEPAAGMNPQETAALAGLVRRLRDAMGLAVLLIEQNAAVALAIADRGYVFGVGRVVTSGTGRGLSADGRVQRAYLGMD